MNKRKIAGYSVQLRAAYKRDGRSWIASAPALHLGTQDRTKKAALQGLREAVEAWFESCIARGVLDAALQEVGFTKTAPGEIGDAPNVVNVRYEQDAPETAPADEPERLHFDVGGFKGTDYILGQLPAYIAAKQLGEASRAAG
jgi:hypothetical protein